MAKSKALATVDHRVPKGSSLSKKEWLLLQATQAWGESFFKLGVVLRSIYEDEDHKDANYTSFHEYMNDRQPLGINARHGYRLISAMDKRQLLPDFTGNGSDPMGQSAWTERAIRPLTQKEFSRADVRRLGKKIATRVKRGENLTAKLVKEICDTDRGVEKKTKARKEKIFKQASLAKNLELAVKMIIGLRIGFENYYEDAWTEVEIANPHLTRSLVTELDNLTSYFKE